MSDPVNELNEIASRVATLAKSKGADDAEAIIRDGSELTTKVRMGEAELVQEAGSRAVGLRVFCDRRSAVTYSSDLRPEALEAWVENTVALAKLSEPDELNTLPDGGFATEFPDLELYDPSVEGVTAEQALKLALAGEKAALGYDERITNSQGATWSRVVGGMAFANTAGFVAGSHGSYVSFSVEPVCDEPDGKKRNGSWWTASRFLGALASPEEVGLEAARRTVRQLGSAKIDTGDRVIIFEPEVARSLVSTVFGVTNGSAFHCKSTYLLEREGTAIASDLVTIEDDPHILRAPGSKSFDGDGLPTRKNVLVDRGLLKTVICDTYAARKLGRESTHSAGRGVGGSPCPTSSNLYMKAGTDTPEEILAASEGALYVTSMMGFGFNAITGDFSRGAAGFLVEDGKLGRPVSEVTISSNFDTMLKGIDMLGDDLEFRSSISAPTVRIASMTVAGS
ncbi:MAG: TldD/PmbA family protein [Myxococcales bacterium]|nr:TldD/PmbA family protein [Myxococcales bacterium]